jgi:hypothetical protein
MNSEINARGGTRVGWFNATWPFATLSATANRLSLSCGVFGSWKFSPEDVVRLESYGSIPILSSGIRIVHANPQYPEKVVFWCFGSPDRLIRRIGELGFRPRATAAQIVHRATNPLRWSFIITALAVWNALIIVDTSALGDDSHKPGVLSLLAFALLFLTAFGLTRFSEIQALVLKPGRSVSEILPMVRLIQFISSVGLVAFAIQYFFGSIPAS